MQADKPRGTWKLEDGLFSYHAATEAEALELREELQSLGGSRVERDGAFLYSKVSSSDYEDEADGYEDCESCEDVRQAVRELTEAGFAVSGDVEAEPDFGPSLLEELDSLRGNVYEVEPEDCEGFSDMGFGSLEALRSHGPKTAEDFRRAMAEGRRFVFVSEHAEGGDYGGSGSVGKANLRSLLALAEEHGLEGGSDYWELSGAHGSYGLALRLDLRSAPMLEALRALEDYPVVCDEELSEVELEEQGESWDGYARSGFVRELESREALDLSDVEAEAVFELFERARDLANVYWIHETGGAYIDVEAVAEHVSREDVLALPGAKREPEDVEADARVCARLPEVYEALRLLQLEASERDGYRSGARLEEREEALRVALGAPSEDVLRSAEGFLAEVARWPIAEHPKRAQHPQEAEHGLEDVRAELAQLRAQVGIVARAARKELERLRPERFKRETERYPFGPLPTETPPERE